MLDRDFIVFGRTRVFYINDMFDIATGIVEVVEYIDENKNRPDFLDKFTIKVKSEPENTYIELYRKDVFFSVEKANEVLIEKLKEHIQTQNTFAFNLVNFISTYGIEAYLYESDADIFKDESIKGDIVENTVYFNKYSVNKDKHYKLVLKVLDNVYSTEYTDMTIYNGQFNNSDINYNTLVRINYPDDYNYYRANVTDITYTQKDNQFMVVILSSSDEILAESKYVNTEVLPEGYCRISVNRFNPTLLDGIQYWVPEQNKHYKLKLVEKLTDVVYTYTYNEYVTYEDLTSDMAMSFSSFTKDE